MLRMFWCIVGDVRRSGTMLKLHIQKGFEIISRS
jgi:hypothetical protein